MDNTNSNSPSTPRAQDILRKAAVRRSVAREFIDLLLVNKKWWLVPVVLAVVLLGVLVFLSGTAAAPFIYPLF